MTAGLQRLKFLAQLGAASNPCRSTTLSQFGDSAWEV
jgi:hypothetical protein